VVLVLVVRLVMVVVVTVVVIVGVVVVVMVGVVVVVVGVLHDCSSKSLSFTLFKTNQEALVVYQTEMNTLNFHRD